MNSPPVDSGDRPAAADYLAARRRMKRAWDAHGRRAGREVFNEANAAVEAAVGAVIRIHGLDPDPDDPLDQLFAVAGGELPLDKAERLRDILHPPELAPLQPPGRRSIGASLAAWHTANAIDSARALDYLTSCQEAVNLLGGILDRQRPGLLGKLSG